MRRALAVDVVISQILKYGEVARGLKGARIRLNSGRASKQTRAWSLDRVDRDTQSHHSEEGWLYLDVPQDSAIRKSQDTPHIPRLDGGVLKDVAVCDGLLALDSPQLHFDTEGASVDDQKIKIGSLLFTNRVLLRPGLYQSPGRIEGDYNYQKIRAQW